MNSIKDTVINKDDKNIPLAYKNGYIYFNDIKIMVNKNVLIPRIETEDIIKYILNEIKINPKYKNKKITILEVGTGSGCISINLAAKINNCKITAIDISKKALDVAILNAKNNKVLNKINFLQNDLLNNILDDYNFIVANLPYIPSSYIKELDPSVKEYEPLIALDGGEDGFYLYRKMFDQIIKNKIKFNYLIIELDDSHVDTAFDFAKDVFKNNSVKVLKDKYKYDRFLSVN